MVLPYQYLDAHDDALVMCVKLSDKCIDAESALCSVWPRRRMGRQPSYEIFDRSKWLIHRGRFNEALYPWHHRQQGVSFLFAPLCESITKWNKAMVLVVHADWNAQCIESVVMIA